MDQQPHFQLTANHLAVKQALQRRLQELGGRVERIEDSLRAPLAADWEEQAAELADDETLMALDTACQTEIEQIRSTLLRIETGNFGVCATCGAPIGAARLAVLPTAALCIDCADRAR